MLQFVVLVSIIAIKHPISVSRFFPVTHPCTDVNRENKKRQFLSLSIPSFVIHSRNMELGKYDEIISSQTPLLFESLAPANGDNNYRT